MGKIPEKINQEIFRKTPEVAKILSLLSGLDWDFKTGALRLEGAGGFGRLFLAGGSVITTPKPGTMENVGFFFSGDTFILKQANGLDFQDSDGNRGYLWMISQAGKLIRGKITSNVVINLGAAHFGLDTYGNIVGDSLPIYAICNGATADDFTPIFGVGYCGGFTYVRNTQDTQTPSSATAPESILTNVDVSVDNSPAICIGYIRADRNDTTNLWTIQGAFPGFSLDGIPRPWNPHSVGTSDQPTAINFTWWQYGKIAVVEYNPTNLLTSNSTGWSFDNLPVKPKYQENQSGAFVWDNTVPQSTAPYLGTAAGSRTLTIGKNYASSNFTASGGKQAAFQVTYEIYQP